MPGKFSVYWIILHHYLVSLYYFLFFLELAYFYQTVFLVGPPTSETSPQTARLHQPLLPRPHTAQVSGHSCVPLFHQRSRLCRSRGHLPASLPAYILGTLRPSFPVPRGKAPSASGSRGSGCRVFGRQ